MTAPPPVLARVRRGPSVESTHRRDVAVVEESGRVVGSRGNPALPTFLRSAAKPFQALPLLEAGGAERFRLTDRDVALIYATILVTTTIGGGAALREVGRQGVDAALARCASHSRVSPRALTSRP